MRRTQRFLEPVLALANVGRSRIIRTIREPERHVTASEPLRDGRALAAVIQGPGTHDGIGVPERAELVVLVLKQIRVDGARHHAGSGGEGRDLGCVFESARKIPLHVQGYRRTDARDRVHVSGITEFFGGRRRRSRLQVFAEARAVFANPHEGSSIRNASSAATIASVACEFMIAPSIAPCRSEVRKAKRSARTERGAGAPRVSA
jgi:hypothetical protein